MNCPRCGSPIEGKVHFCPQCGASLPKVESTRPCPHCGAQIDRRAALCPHCGEQTTGTKAASHSDKLAELRARIEAEMRMPPVEIRRAGAKPRKRPGPRRAPSGGTAQRPHEPTPTSALKAEPKAGAGRAPEPAAQASAPVTPAPPKESERPPQAPKAPPEVAREAPAPEPESARPREEAPQRAEPSPRRPKKQAPRQAEPQQQQDAVPEAPQAVPDEDRQPPVDRVVLRPSEVRPRTQTIVVDSVARPTGETEPSAPPAEPVQAQAPVEEAYEPAAPLEPNVQVQEPVEEAHEETAWRESDVQAQAPVEEAYEEAAWQEEPEPDYGMEAEPEPVPGLEAELDSDAPPYEEAQYEAEPEPAAVPEIQAVAAEEEAAAQPQPWVEVAPPAARRMDGRTSRMLTITGLLAGVTLATAALIGADRAGLSLPGLSLFGEKPATPIPTETAVFVVEPEKTSTSGTLAATAQLTPTLVPTFTPQAPATPEPSGEGTVTHVVQPGESLTQIATDYGVSVAAIIQANGLDSEVIIPGQELIIPGQAQSANTTPTVHVVQQGENLAAIAQKYGVSTADLMAANDIADPNTIRIGQELTIPGTGGATTQPTLAPTATSTPTETPEPTVAATATVPLATTMSITPTPVAGAFEFAAPNLLTPANGATVQGAEDIVLNWTSVGLLDDDTWYVIKIWRDDPSLPTPPTGWTRTTAWRIPASFRPTGDSSGRFYWSVTVMRAVEGQEPQPVSPVSQERWFEWK